MGMCVPTVKPENSYPELSISSYVVTNDYPDAYDFKSRMVAVRKFLTPKDFTSAAFFCDHENFRMVPLAEVKEKELSSFQMIITKEQDTFFLKKPNDFKRKQLLSNILSADETGFWKYIREESELNSSGVLVNPEDMFVFGRKIVRIRSLNLRQGSEDIYDMINDHQTVTSLDKNSILSGNMCRVCHGDESNPDTNPLLAPCRCAGSAKYIHFKCLRKMVENNKFVNIKSLFTITYNLKALICEICLSRFPETLYKDDRRYPMINEDTINPPYLLIEVSTSSRRRMHSIHCIKLNFDKFITLGSSPTCDIRFTDDFISPHHAKFRVTSSGIFLTDECSQFGTFKFFPRIKLHSKNNNFILSFGRSLFRIDSSNPPNPNADDLPKKSNLKIRFSKLHKNDPNEITEFENILNVEETDPEDEFVLIPTEQMFLFKDGQGNKKNVSSFEDGAK